MFGLEDVLTLGRLGRQCGVGSHRERCVNWMLVGFGFVDKMLKNLAKK